MSNQKTTQLTRLLPNQVTGADIIPIVDVSALESGPTGETKGIHAQDLSTWISNNGGVPLSASFQASQTSNGLWFDESVTPAGDPNKYCYAPFPPLGNQFSLFVRGFIPANLAHPQPGYRVIFGAGPNFDGLVNGINAAYIGISNYDLMGYAADGSGGKYVNIPNFFLDNPNRVFGAILTKNSAGTLELFVNGRSATTSSNAAGVVNSSYLTMGLGCGTANDYNINCTIYEAHVYNGALNSTQSMQLFYGGSNSRQPGCVASYTSENLNPGPTQWLDSVGSNHLLLPTIGAFATNPAKKFNLNFRVSNAGYLGDGTTRNVLPEKYFLTSCIVESDFKPLVSVGSAYNIAPVSASGTGSWQDNRVPFTSASYGVNPLGLISLGVAHADRTIYVAFNGSAAPCTFSFEGYVRT
jgi:hypothetical protein